MTHYVKIRGKLIHLIFVALGQKQKNPYTVEEKNKLGVLY